MTKYIPPALARKLARDPKRLWRATHTDLVSIPAFDRPTPEQLAQPRPDGNVDYYSYLLWLRTRLRGEWYQLCDKLQRCGNEFYSVVMCTPAQRRRNVRRNLEMTYRALRRTEMSLAIPAYMYEDGITIEERREEAAFRACRRAAMCSGGSQSPRSDVYMPRLLQGPTPSPPKKKKQKPHNPLIDVMAVLYNRDEVSRSEILRRCRRWSAQDVMIVLASLIRSGEIKETRVKSTGRPKSIYHVQAVQRPSQSTT